MSAPGERILALEVIGTTVIVTMDGLRQGYMPGPSQYVAAMALYTILAAMAALGSGPAKIAAGLGGLVLLTVLVSNAGSKGTASGAEPKATAVLGSLSAASARIGSSSTTVAKGYQGA